MPDASPRRRRAPRDTADPAAQAAPARPRDDEGALGGLFERFAQRTARLTGRPFAFLGAFVFVLLWGATGPLFGFSDSWQLVVNTTTTIVTFLMVFLIQHSQNRDTLAIQIKLAELILVMKGAKDEIATAEDHSERYLESLHREVQERIGKGRGRPAA